MGAESRDDLNKLSEDLGFASTKLGRTPDARNSLIAKVLSHLDKIDFGLEESDSDMRRRESNQNCIHLIYMNFPG